MIENKPTVIVIGYGKSLFTVGNSERQRLCQCAEHTAHLHTIVFTSREDDLPVTSVSSAFTLYPTNARTRLGMIVAAANIAWRLSATTPPGTIISTQDAFATGIVGYVIKRFRGLRWVIQEHGDVFLQPYWRSESIVNRGLYYIGRYLITVSDGVRVVSHRIHQKMLQLGVEASQITVLPVAIDVTQFIPKQNYRTAFDTAPFHYITAARLVPQKNLTLLLAAFYQAWQQNPALRLSIVGQGSEHPALTAMLEQQYPDRASSPVTMIDWSNDVAALFKQADAYVLSSNYEGWGRVLIEAMVVGLPVVTTDVGCVGEVVHHGVHGTVVPVNNQAALTEALCQLATDNELYNQYVASVRALDTSILPGAQFDQYGQQWVATLTNF